MPSPPASTQARLWQDADLSDGGRLYVILDGARDKRIYPNVLLSEARYACLYRGRLPEALERAAPYLVELQPDSAFTTWLFKFGWGHSWGVFLRSSASLDTLRRHFRRFLRVRDHRGRRLLFRYYDPRVLRVYLPTCTAAELAYVFGPVARFYLDTTEATVIQTFDRRALGLAPPAEARPNGPRAMLVIREAQMAHLRDGVLKALEHRIRAALLASEPTLLERYTEPELDALIKAGRIASARYGFTAEDEVRRFVACLARFGPDFVTREPWAQAVYNDPGLPPAEKLHRFEQHGSPSPEAS